MRIGTRKRLKVKRERVKAMCLFCKIIKKKIPATLAYEDNDVLAFHDINPQAPKHILVIPKKHIESLNTLAPEDSAVVAKIYQVIPQIARKEGIAESGYRVVVNTNRDAGQAVPHLHFHILGGRSMNWPPG